MLLQACFRVRFSTSCIQTWRSFSSLQAKNSFSLDKLWKQSGNTIFVRWKLIATRKPRRFRPQYTKDKVSREFDLIYENNMNKLLFWSQICMYSLTIPTVLGSAWIVVSHIQDIPSKLTVTHPASTALLYVAFGASLLFFVNVVCRRSIQRIYYEADSKKYIAVVQNWMMMPSKLEFELKDATRKVPSITKAKFGNLAIKNRIFFVVGTDFQLPKHYNAFMGWEDDKPVAGVKGLDVFDFVQENKKEKSKSRNVK